MLPAQCHREIVDPSIMIKTSLRQLECCEWSLVLHLEDAQLRANRQRRYIYFSVMYIYKSGRNVGGLEGARRWTCVEGGLEVLDDIDLTNRSQRGD